MNESFLINTLSINFRITRLIDTQIHAATVDLNMDLEFSDDHTRGAQAANLKKMRRWIDEILDNCIAFNVHSDLNTSLFGEVTNHVMFCPDEPHDHLLLLLILSKLNAIGDGAVVIRNASIHSDINKGFGNNFIGDPLDMLPSAEEWMGVRRYWDQPWWNRSDGGMMDIPANDDDDIDAKPDILVDIGPGFEVASVISAVKTSESKPAEIIRPNFKPKIIRNEQND